MTFCCAFADHYSQPLPDAFDILGLEPSLDLSAAAVRAAFLAKTAQAGDEHAPALNAAKGVLLDAEQRAGLLLARLGGPAASSDRSLPDGFLMAMMQAREDAEAAIASQNTAKIESFIAWAETQRDGHIARLRPLLVAGASAEALKLARRELNAWRYIERMIEQLSQAGDEDAGTGQGQGAGA